MRTFPRYSFLSNCSLGATYITDGALMCCTEGSELSPLILEETLPVLFKNHRFATTEDHLAKKNITSFGLCVLLNNQQCQPLTFRKWQSDTASGGVRTSEEVEDFLNSDATTVCERGGVICFYTDGQY